MSARWETASRWYEAEIVCDLFGMWTVVRSWGGKGSRLHGSMTDVVDGPAAGSAYIDTLDKQRSRRNPPYIRIR
ncbi:MAG: hypothetical protein PHT60_15350 [Acidiphilium sp.]|nr:hypothetical protein [Acidiphilium sp.]